MTDDLGTVVVDVDTIEIGTTFHTHIAVRDILRRGRGYQRGALKWIRQPGGAPFPDVDALLDALMDQLAQGHEVIPVGPACEGFNYKKGCPGHRGVSDG